MAVIGKFVQTTTERKRYRIDYSDWLQPTEVLSLVTYESIPASPTPCAVDAFAIDVDQEHATIFVSGGVDGVQYKILATAHTSFGQVKEDEISFRIRNY